MPGIFGRLIDSPYDQDQRPRRDSSRQAQKCAEDDEDHFQLLYGFEFSTKYGGPNPTSTVKIQKSDVDGDHFRLTTGADAGIEPAVGFPERTDRSEGGLLFPPDLKATIGYLSAQTHFDKCCNEIIIIEIIDQAPFGFFV